MYLRGGDVTVGKLEIAAREGENLFSVILDIDRYGSFQENP